MCGRYYRTPGKQALADALHAEAIGDEVDYTPGYNIAPTAIQPVLRQARDILERELVPMRWGLIGSVRPASIRTQHIQRTSGSLESSSFWKRPLHLHRCIVPVSGYFEWRKSDKTAFRFTVGHEAVFGLAGLWDAWKAQDGSWLQSYTIITTDPNTLAESVHNRMPAILKPKDYDEWLDRMEVERPPVHLLKPFDLALMLIHAAHPKVGNVRIKALTC